MRGSSTARSTLSLATSMASLLERYNKWRHGNNASTSTDSLTKAVAQISINPDVKWEELSGPALLSIAFYLISDWPSKNRALMVLFRVCRNWHADLNCDAVWAALCKAAGMADSLRTREAYISRRALLHGGLDMSDQEELEFPVHFTTPLPTHPSQQYEMPYADGCDRAGFIAKKRSSSPDISWVFSERGYSAEQDKVAWFQVYVKNFKDECRIGFTDDPASLLERRARMSYEEPHAWLYSDGKRMRGVTEAGQRNNPTAQAKITHFMKGSRITVRLDFEKDEASWFLEQLRQRPQHIHTTKGLPKGGPIHAAIVLDAAGDEVCFNPLVPDETRRTMEAILLLSKCLKLEESFAAKANLDEQSLNFEANFITSMFVQKSWAQYDGVSAALASAVALAALLGPLNDSLDLNLPDRMGGQGKEGTCPPWLRKDEAGQVAALKHWVENDEEAIEALGGRWRVVDLSDVSVSVA